MGNIVKQPSPIEEITPHAKPIICITRQVAYELLKAHGIDKAVMPLIDMLINSNKTLTADNLQLMKQIEDKGKC